MPMIRKFSRPASKLVQLTTLSAALAALLGIATCAVGQTPTAIGSITIAGAERYSAGVWDTGTATATINGLSVQVPYGEYSTPASLAAGVAAKISSDCSLPVFAHAVGAVVSFYPKPGQTVTSSSFTTASNDPSVFPTSSFPIQQSSSGGLPDSPVITPPFSLAQGPVGMGFTINGANYGANDSASNTYVTLNGTIMNTVSWSPTQIIVQVPTGATTGNVVVTVGGEASAGVPFTVTSPFGCTTQ